MSSISTPVTVGHTISCSIVYFDQNGHPMLTPPTPDSAPVWTKTAPDTVDTMAVSADGKTNVITTVGPGSDTVGVTVVEAGVSFAASLDFTIQAEPQVLTSIGIVATVSP